VLYQASKGVTDLMVPSRPDIKPRLLLTFAAVMDEMGKAMMGTARPRAKIAPSGCARRPSRTRLLDEISLRGAKGVLINITGGHDLTLVDTGTRRRTASAKKSTQTRILSLVHARH